MLSALAVEKVLQALMATVTGCLALATMVLTTGAETTGMLTAAPIETGAGSLSVVAEMLT
jgi:hypothetical protein